MEKETIIVTRYDQAMEELRKSGTVSIETGGGREWNEHVAQELSERMNQKVMLIGVNPQYTREDGIFVYSVDIKTNKQASLLLSDDKDDYFI